MEVNDSERQGERNTVRGYKSRRENGRSWKITHREPVEKRGDGAKEIRKVKSFLWITRSPCLLMTSHEK